MLVFLKQALQDHYSIGAVLPSSRWLAKRMVQPARAAVGRKRILEVGAGTGAITRKILPLLEVGDEFHVVEVNAEFAAILESKVLGPFRERNPGKQVTLSCQGIESMRGGEKFDHIICSLPFNNFSPQRVRALFRLLVSVLDSGGEMTYFEYFGRYPVKAPLVGRDGRKRMRALDAIRRSMLRRYQGSRRLVLWNVLPAYVVRLRAGASKSA